MCVHAHIYACDRRARVRGRARVRDAKQTIELITAILCPRYTEINLPWQFDLPCTLRLTLPLQCYLICVTELAGPRILPSLSSTLISGDTWFVGIPTSQLILISDYS